MGLAIKGLKLEWLYFAIKTILFYFALLGIADKATLAGFIETQKVKNHDFYQCQMTKHKWQNNYKYQITNDKILVFYILNFWILDLVITFGY
jgi:hypothetical protein